MRTRRAEATASRLDDAARGEGAGFDAVWMTGMEGACSPRRAPGADGPMRPAKRTGRVAEERRLCYVGMTRARKRLSLSLARCRSLFGELRSTFLAIRPRAPGGLTEGLASLERLSRCQERARKDVFYDDFDQRPDTTRMPPLPARNKMRESGYDPASKPVVRRRPRWAAWGRRARKHPLRSGTVGQRRRGHEPQAGGPLRSGVGVKRFWPASSTRPKTGRFQYRR